METIQGRPRAPRTRSFGGAGVPAGSHQSIHFRPMAACPPPSRPLLCAAIHGGTGCRPIAPPPPALQDQMTCRQARLTRFGVGPSGPGQRGTPEMGARWQTRLGRMRPQRPVLRPSLPRVPGRCGPPPRLEPPLASIDQPPLQPGSGSGANSQSQNRRRLVLTARPSNAPIDRALDSTDDGARPAPTGS